MKSIKISIFVLIITLISCSKSNENGAIDYGYDYFPIDTNKQYVYAVDSISYNSNTKGIDTFHFQIKTQFVNNYIDSNGFKIWRLQRFAKYKNADNYVEIQNNFVQFYNNKYILTDNNADFVKGIFPLKKNLEWNGNLYNSFGKISSMVDFINEDFEITDTLFNQTLKITEEQSEDFIFSIERVSVYQKNRGIVYFKNKKIETQVNQLGQEIKSGFDYTQKLIEILPQ